MIMASIYIVAFEILKSSIVKRIKDFYTHGFDVDPVYKTEVLSKNRSEVYASLEWLKENGAICEDDIVRFGEIKDCRNLIAHEITRLLMDGLPSNLLENYQAMITLLDKIGFSGNCRDSATYGG